MRNNMTQKNIPKIRFNGFDDEWEEKKLGAIGDIITGSTPSTQEQSYYSRDGIPWVTPTDITQNITFTTARHLSKSGENVARIAPKNTILVTCIASIGKNTMLGTKGGFNQQINGVVPNEQEYHAYFLFSESTLWANEMKRSAASGTMQIVNKAEFSELRTYTPKYREQKKIGNYFQKLDKLIDLQQKELEKLKNLKKAMLEKMFPKKGSNVPEIRFNGFDGDWEERKFGTTFSNIANNTLSRAELNFISGFAKNIHYGDVLVKFGSLLDVVKDEIPFISNATLISKFKSSKLQDGDVIIADAAEDELVGKCTELVNVDNEFVVSGLHTIPVRPLKSFASKYLGYYMNSPSYHNQLLRLLQGTKVLSISKSAIKDTVVLFPSVAEQQKIGNYFQKLDKLISLQQKELDKLKNIKKACLEKMFV